MQESDKINSTFKFNDMPIHNEKFDSYRLKREEIEKAIALLESHGFYVYNKEKKYAADREVYSNKED